MEELKAFVINATDTVVGKDIEEVINWYSSEMGCAANELEVEPLEDDLTTYFDELGGISEAVAELLNSKNKDEITITKKRGEYFKVVNIKARLKEIINYKEPFVLCSTEY